MGKAAKKSAEPLSESPGRFDKDGNYLADPRGAAGTRVVPPEEIASYLAQRDAEEAIENADDDGDASQDGPA